MRSFRRGALAVVAALAAPSLAAAQDSVPAAASWPALDSPAEPSQAVPVTPDATPPQGSAPAALDPFPLPPSSAAPASDGPPPFPDIPGDTAPGLAPPAPAATSATTVPDIEDELPDAGKADAPPTTSRRRTRSVPSPSPQAEPHSLDRPAAALAAIPQPAGAGSLDSATIQRITDKLVGLRFLSSAADAQDPGLFADAVKAFQSSVGISPTGTLDRDTIGRLVTQ